MRFNSVQQCPGHDHPGWRPTSSDQQAEWTAGMGDTRSLTFDGSNLAGRSAVTRGTHGRAALRGVVALDGPSGTGKSTVARKLAVALHARYLDTGAMYRAATLAVLRNGI